MKKILIVEDNKTLAKLISKKIEIELGIDTDIAYSLQEAKLFLSRFKYFLALLDVNLPDAPNGEVIDFVLSKGCGAIVLTGIIDKEFRKTVLQKNIVDYVNKSSIENINYVIKVIERLIKNQNHKVLIVEDNKVFRQQMQILLENMFFEVNAVAHGEEAIGMLETKSYSLVVTDYNMPVMDGLELTNHIRKEYSKNELAIVVASSNTEDEVIASFLKNGANDYIKKPFSKEEFICRINNTIEALENIYTLTNHLSRDFLTGLYSRHHFIMMLDPYFSEEYDKNFSLALFNIDNGKSLLSKYGSHIKDNILVKIADIIRTSTSKDDIVSRYGDDEYCVLFSDISNEELDRLCKKIELEVTQIDLKDVHQEPINITISYITMLKPLDTKDETLSELDMLLFQKLR